MILYFREPNGDYLAADKGSEDYYRQIGKPDLLEGRATAIAGCVGSVCTTGISRKFLKTCRHVRKRDVPAEWLKAFGVE